MLGLISFDKFSQGAPLLQCMLGCNKVVHLVFFYERFIFYMTVVTGKTAHYYYQNYYYYYYVIIIIMGTAAGPVNPPVLFFFYFRMQQTFTVPSESNKPSRKFFFYLE